LGRIIAGKLIMLVPVLILVSLGAFALLQLVPGDPAVAVLGPDAQPDQIELVHEQLGVDRPLVQQYLSWLGDVVRGDFGTSLFPPKIPVSEMIKQRLPVTLEIALLSLTLSLAAALPIALASAYRPGGRFDRLATGLTFGAISIPSFLAGLLLVYFLVFHNGIVRLLVAVLGVLAIAAVARWFLRRVREIDAAVAYGNAGLAQAGPPAGGRNLSAAYIGTDPGAATTTRPTGVPAAQSALPSRSKTIVTGAVVVAGMAATVALLVLAWPDFPRQGFVRITDGGIFSNLRSVALPVLTLAITEMAVFSRLLRADLISTLGEDYILSARAKGMPARRIMVRDALRPSCFSLITVIGVTIGRIIGGTVIVETIFNIPGMGRMVVEAISRKDYPVVQATVLLVAVVWVLVSAVVDIAYAYLDPRIRRGKI
jgi:peptide/nickel transport system permease protein